MYRQDPGAYHPHHPYYQRAYSVQGYSTNDAVMDGARQTKTLGPSHRRDMMMSSKSVDYSELDAGAAAAAASVASGSTKDADARHRRHRSRSIEDMHGMAACKQDLNSMTLDSSALKRMLQPVLSVESPPASPLTSPEMGRRGASSAADCRSVVNDGFQSEPEISRFQFIFN